jgi:hypothetical protein
MKRVLLSLSVGSLLWSFGGTARATDFYLDPQNGAASGDGTAAAPWKTLEEVVSAGLFASTVKAGDTVHLLSGYHGELNLVSGNNSPAITIVEDPGETAQLGRVRFGNTSGWVLDGVSVSPSYASSYSTIDMVSVGDAASDVTVQNCDIFSIADASGWTASDWVDVASSGISVGGSNITIKNNLVKNVRFGISVDGNGAMIDHNSVVNFSADGLRGLGDDDTFQYNLVKNSYVGGSDDANHDDGFQSWSVGPGGVGTGEVKNMVLRGNQCSGTASVPDSCGCPVVLNETQDAKVKAAQSGYDAWVQAGCGPFPCGKACFAGTTGICDPSNGTCQWTTN